MLTCFTRAWNRVKGLKVPTGGPAGLVYTCGVLNMIIFGSGLIILGITNNCLEDVLIGVAQLLLPIVGWLWSLVWGVLIIIGKYRKGPGDLTNEPC
ncbi:hypothetical protein BBBOND_0307450 [Babesia bigemina]|uniref:Transmembrane protein n=1 Tax=Babesia bigemina TaxID=5866 RepID=A0A061D847_BABBI|nr:hypothetical protein BBBOND_0307450 [Babesia bigemina]CDR96841.1 hypothetical protein BBBOND_0307450 [Babesia bigemina]|eukprot:XP_012769027.1 hypothetical protein BBBOND_0307450 [Babesia bigemina]